ncbi:pyruvate dehydrogenase (acetyl-transferring) E1 component subunit alpha [Arthrobacter sp. TS-15]|uniref:pyruvate dehydrogenase (acetyl-transferring) E1 component subunit alpha n=1 Tax=Micrococcaceae TaxID=1268 RepID=UPI00115F083A|nr:MULTISPECIES: pyruvate dehydrogenase (acetyl-transferring) E1 component subunit alpha [Micrococcaceae]MCM0617196.1 pyruvate dehydrogenase (acetyl-transferring) E1 component subunit alpha [Paenarthrobacter sp. TYUT067]TQS90579.1 pyruvate dehydrogenase (acetyl-transferring) E1 component subunit alpha [Arthrobacter sp. TS-15]
MLTDQAGKGVHHHTPSPEHSAQIPLRTGGELLQLVSPEGERISHPEFDIWVKDIGDEHLCSLYEDMTVIRRIDAEATALQRQGELALWPPLLGQEAAQIGSSRSLRDDDFVFPSYRESGVAYVRGAHLSEIARVWRGNASYGWDPMRINLATPQIIIGSQSLHATGYAMGVQLDGANTAVLAYFGDGATSEGDVNEAMVFAASYQAPVVFFCQNNHWAISEPVRVQSHVQLADRPTGFGIPSMRVDGNDVLAVMAATRVALDRARKGGGPTFIEAVTYRMGPHTTADDPTRYRDPIELEDWAAKDPILRLRKLLEAKGLLTDDVEARVKSKADAVAAELRSSCIDMPDPEPLDVFNHVYSTPNPWIERQRDHYSRYLNSFNQPAEEGAL